MSELVERRPEDATLAALDDDAAALSRILMAVEVIAAHQPKREIRKELREIIEAIKAAKQIRIEGRAAYTKRGKPCDES